MKKGVMMKKVCLFDRICPYVTILVVWSAISLVISANSLVDLSIIQVMGWFVMIVVFSHLGYVMTLNKQEPREAGHVGGIAGTVYGFISAIFAMISFYFFPSVFNQTMQQAIAQGATKEMAIGMIKLGVYLSFITAPITMAIIGALIAAVSAWITKRYSFSRIKK